jgi:uncharacterized protein YgiM (DUF1202 family)
MNRESISRKMFFCSAWNSKKDKQPSRLELEESPRSRRRILKPAERGGVGDLDASDTDEAYSSAAEIDSSNTSSGYTDRRVTHRPGPRTGGGGLVTEVLLDFEPLPDREGRELAVKKGDVVRVLFRSGQWLYVTMGRGKEGYVPAGYCRAFAPPEMQPAACEANSKQIEQQQDRAGCLNRSASTKQRQEAKLEKGKTVVALYNFRAQERDDLELKKGDRVTVTHSGDGEWVWVRNCDGEEGCVPTTYVSLEDDKKYVKPTTFDERRDSELLRDILSTVVVEKRHRNPTAPTSRGRSGDTSMSMSNTRGDNRRQQTAGGPEMEKTGHPSIRAHSAMDLREAGTRGMAMTGVPVNRLRQRQNPQQRRFAPKLQRPDLAPITEAEQINRNKRENKQEARVRSPTSDQEAEKVDRHPSRRENQRPVGSRQILAPGQARYPSRALSFQHVTAGGCGRDLQEKILTSHSLRPADFSFDNIAQLLKEQATGRPCLLAEKLETPTSSMISTTSDGSSGGSTSPPRSFPTKKLDINRLQLEARLRLSHSRLGINSSFSSIPMISTNRYQPKRPLPPPITPEQSWSYSNV